YQAEDGIRDRNVTGVQTCALPISSVQKLFKSKKWTSEETEDMRKLKEDPSSIYTLVRRYGLRTKDSNVDSDANKKLLTAYIQERSEERRVGKECRCRRWREKRNIR